MLDRRRRCGLFATRERIGWSYWVRWKNEAALDAALNSNIVSGVTLNEFTISQMALRYVVHLMPYDLIWAVLYRYGALKGGLQLLGVLPKRFQDTHLFIQDHNRKVARAAMSANGVQLAGCPIGADPVAYEWKRRSTFVSMVLGSMA